MRAPSIDDQVFLEEGGEQFGAVRAVSPAGRQEIVIYVENAGDFVVPLEAVRAVHDGKVVLSAKKLGPQLRAAIAGAHARELPTDQL